MKIYNDVLGGVSTNCYYVVNDNVNECIIIDPAGEFERIKARVEKLNVTVKGVLLTHGHFDHILAVDKVRAEYGVNVYASREEADILERESLNLSVSFGFGFKTKADVYLENGEEFELAGMKVFAIHTPGHTKGGMCYYFANEDVVFSGDTLFCQSVGRTDFPTGSMAKLVSSIKERLLVLPENTKVYPGHGESTTIEYEMRHNPYLV